MASPAFLVDRSQVDGNTVIRFVGELDLESQEHAKTEAMRALTTGVDGTLVLDLSELSFCGSSGLRVLVQLQQEAQRRGGAVVLRHPHPAVRLVLQASGIDKIFVIDDQDDNHAHATTMSGEGLQSEEIWLRSRRLRQKSATLRAQSTDRIVSAKSAIAASRQRIRPVQSGTTMPLPSARAN